LYVLGESGGGGGTGAGAGGLGTTHGSFPAAAKLSSAAALSARSDIIRGAHEGLWFGVSWPRTPRASQARKVVSFVDDSWMTHVSSS
jgi:hypothetical protein